MKNILRYTFSFFFTFFLIIDIVYCNYPTRNDTITLKKDIELINQNLNIIKNNLDYESDTFLNLTRETLAYAKEIKYNNGIKRSYLYLAQTYRARNNYDSAIYYYNKGLNLPFDDLNLKVQFFRDLANTYRTIGDYSTALEINLNLKELVEREKSTESYYFTYNLLALSYQTLMEYELAEKFYKKSIELALKDSSEAYAGIVLANMGKLYYDQNKLDTALNYYEKGVKIEEKYQLYANAGNSYNTIANIYLKMDQLDSARYFLFKAFDYNNKADNRIGLVKTLLGVSNYYFQINDLENAILHIERAINYASELKLSSVLSETLFLKSKINAKQKNYQQAYANLDEFFELYKSIYDVKKINKAKALEHRIIQQEKEKELVELELKKQQTINRLLFIIGGLLLTLVIVALFFIIHYKRSNRTLSKAKEKAEESDKLKSQFLKTISHEIRTPLNGIVGFSEIITSEKVTQKERIEIDQIIQKNSNELISTIENIVDLAHLTTNQFRLNIVKIELSAFFSNLISKIKSDYYFPDTKTIKINIFNKTKLDICTDKYILQKMISELLKNAILYTEKGEINIGYEKHNSDLKIFVQDTGPGIPKEKLDNFFTPFHRGSEHINNKISGSGIGLSLVYNFSKLIGANLIVDSKKGRGSNFDIILPLKTNNKLLQHD
ncbi:MAG: tetratricopeptide repeat-containing sensor histidine kinase [Bacteroidota bacterium]